MGVLQELVSVARGYEYLFGPLIRRARPFSAPSECPTSSCRHRVISSFLTEAYSHAGSEIKMKQLSKQRGKFLDGFKKCHFDLIGSDLHLAHRHGNDGKRQKQIDWEGTHHHKQKKRLTSTTNKNTEKNIHR